MLALSKVDLLATTQVDAARREWERRLGPEVPVIATSSATGAGVHELGQLLLERVPAVPAAEAGARAPSALGTRASDERTRDFAQGAAARAGAGDAELAEHMVFTPVGAGRGFTVEQLGQRTFAVHGRGVERLLARYDIDNEDALAYLEERLRKIGVIAALEDAGFEPGDELQIAGVPFELDPRAP